MVQTRFMINLSYLYCLAHFRFNINLEMCLKYQINLTKFG